MSNRSERLFSVLSHLSDTHIDEAANLPQKHNFHWKQWSTAAACITLAVITASIFPHLGGCGASGGQAGHEEGSVFMSYAGPILPLTLQESAPEITAERTVTMDFAPWVPQWWSNEQEANSRENLTPQERQNVLHDYQERFPEGGQWRTSSDLLVTDTYVLTNPTDQDQTITAQLPFVGSLLTLDTNRPTLTLDGSPLNTELLIGNSSPTSQFSSWEAVNAQLTAGRDRWIAQQPVPEYDDIPVVVYGYQDEVLRAIPKTERVAVHVENTFHLDYSRTGVLNFNYEGLTNDSKNGVMERSFSLPDPWHPTHSRFLVVLGDDVENFTSRLYERPEEAVPFVRVESDLDTVLRYAMQEFLDTRQSAQFLSELSFEQNYALLRRLLPQEDLLNFNSSCYQRGGSLADILGELYWLERIFWVQVEMTIPAGESRTLSASFCKEASFDYTCTHTENEGISGYDLMPWVDSNLHFTNQTAVLEDRGQLELVRQNFGFDLTNGVNTVPLHPDESHYYLEVRRSNQLPREAPKP